MYVAIPLSTSTSKSLLFSGLFSSLVSIIRGSLPVRVNGISSTYPSVIPPIKISRLVGINDIDSMIFSGSGFFHTHKE